MEKKIEIVHPEIHELGKIDRLVSEKLQYPADSAYSADFPRMLSEENLKNLYGVRHPGTGEWISHVGVLPIEWQSDSVSDEKKQLIMIGAVATESGSQGQGYASALIGKIIEDWSGRAEGAFLWGEIPEFYSRFGFQEMNRDQLIVLHEFKNPFESDGIEILNGRELGLEFFKSIYNEQVAKVERTDSDWRKILSIEGTLILGARDSSGKPLAYMATDKGQDFPGVIHEWIGDLAALGALLEEMIEVAKSSSLLSPGIEYLKNNQNHQKSTMIEFIGSILDQGGSSEAIDGALFRDLNLAKNDSFNPSRIWIWGFDSH